MHDKVLVAQGGGPTVVINQSLVGVIREARKFQHVQRIYGARHGVRDKLPTGAGLNDRIGWAVGLPRLHLPGLREGRRCPMDAPSGSGSINNYFCGLIDPYLRHGRCAPMTGSV